MKAPSVICRSRSEAEGILREAGVRVTAIRRTAPAGGAPSGVERVVRQRGSEEGVELVVAASVVLLGGDDRND